MPYRLTVRQGVTPGKVFELARATMIIGRDLKCDIVLNDPEVSRNHTQLTAQAEGYLVEDLGSTNGTFINSQRLVPTTPQLIHVGDMLGLGENLVLEFSVSDVPASTLVASPAEAAPLSEAPIDEPYVAPAFQAEAAPQFPEMPPVVAAEPAWMSTPTPVAPPPPQKSNRNLIIAIVVIAVLLLCCCCLIIGAGAFYFYVNQVNTSNFNFSGLPSLLALLS